MPIDKHSATWREVEKFTSLKLVDARSELENELTSDRRAQWLRGHISALLSVAAMPDDVPTEIPPQDDYS